MTSAFKRVRLVERFNESDPLDLFPAGVAHGEHRDRREDFAGE
jgi:hypothetical protein